MQRLRGARSSSGGLRPSFVGAPEFLIGIMNSGDAQFAAPPRQLRLQNFVFQAKPLPDEVLGGSDEGVPIFL